MHGRVNPNQPGDLEGMDELAARYTISAWKTYTQWGPDGTGFWMDDDAGLALIEKARKLGVRNIAIHKGLAFGPQVLRALDLRGHRAGREAISRRQLPDLPLGLRHRASRKGRTIRRAATGSTGSARASPRTASSPVANVYAELGSTWRFLMRDPDSAAHALGKLFRYCGPDNVLWGTDSIWYGSPQDQIQAFRTFQIAPALRDKHGYPEITRELRAKVFGLNALRIYPVPDEVLEEAPGEGPRVGRARGVPRGSGPELRHLRSAHAPRVPESQGLGRLTARAHRQSILGGCLSYSTMPLWLLAALIFTALSAAREAGHLLSKRRKGSPATGDAEGGDGFTMTSVLGLLALLIAFSFSLSLQRYDARRELVISEANALGTTWLRTRAIG